MPVLVAAVQLQARPILLESSLTSILNVNTTYRLCQQPWHCHTITYPLHHQLWHCLSHHHLPSPSSAVALSITPSLTLSVISHGTGCHTITYPLCHQPWHCLSHYHLPSSSSAMALSHYHLPSPSSAMALAVTLSLTLSVISCGTVCHTIICPLHQQPWHCLSHYHLPSLSTAMALSVTLSLTLSVISNGTGCHTITYPLPQQPWHCHTITYHLCQQPWHRLSHRHLPSPSSAMALSVTSSSPSCAHLPTPISRVRLMNSSMTFLQMSRLTELVTSTSTLCVSLEIWTQQKSQILILWDKLQSNILPMLC